ncbi:ImmA/IrrE family metallo-endopeptidase [Promicromonospora sp. NPDC057138]|uniref:ImmA/IrrE family metallo-endopeptidase n=1 Tax=Promicromonospora sp. NPDC057138 TaxID=3346031 RepID=UPI003631AC97
MGKDTRTLEQKAADREAGEAKVAALQDKLAGAVQELVTGEDWRAAIEFMARFRARSFGNNVLIRQHHLALHAAGLVPHPTPTLLAGIKTWNKLGRFVIKDQPGALIFRPIKARMASRTPDNATSWRDLKKGEHPKPGEVVKSRVVRMGTARVWDVSQTHGKPLAELPQPQLLQGAAPDGLWDGLAQIVAERGFRLLDAPDAAYLDGANGQTHWLKHTVHVRRDMDPAARAKTLAHELGHIALHSIDDVDAVVHRGVAEVEAESFALAIGAAHGMPTDQYTIPYVSGWASSVRGSSPVEVVQATAERVRKAAIAILDRLETLQVPDGKLPAADQEHGHHQGQAAAATAGRTASVRAPWAAASPDDGSARPEAGAQVQGPGL